MNLKFNSFLISLCFIIAQHISCWATDNNSLPIDSISTISLSDTVQVNLADFEKFDAMGNIKSIYAMPRSTTLSNPNWHRMWINTAVLSGAFVGTLLVLECLPEDATAWNRAEIQSQAPFKRWFKNIFKRGPEWDHDKFYFNYILHPYAGAAYFMSARSCGFNTWQSLLYSTCISTIGWEFGVEAFMERPSIQDLFITPLVGSAMGEGFYNIKRYIAKHNYRLLGSPILGNVVAFLVDPVNEVIGYFAGNDARHINDANRNSRELSISPIISPTVKGISLVGYF